MIEDTLKERGSRYGDFKENAECSQALKEVMRAFPGWERLSDSQKESLELNATKDSRIITGDCDWKDNWVDKEGYCRLIVKELEGNEALDELGHDQSGYSSFEDHMISYEHNEPNEDDLPTIPLSLEEYAKSKGFWRSEKLPDNEWWHSTGPPLGFRQMQQMHKEYLNSNKYPNGIQRPPSDEPQ